MAKRRNDRRGVVLLLVLSLLVLFLLIGVTFLVICAQFNRAARAQGVRAIQQLDPQANLDLILYQLLRGVREGEVSSIHGHPILEDLYGHDAVRGAVDRTWLEANGQFVRIEFEPDQLLGASGPVTLQSDFLNGRVLTMLNGTAVGLSARIVDFYPGDAGAAPPVNGFLRVEPFEHDISLGGLVPNEKNSLYAGYPGDTFFINGQPFNGTGAGYDSTSQNLDYLAYDQDGDGMADFPIALMPHYSTYLPASIANNGGADEGYDVSDFQNMFLAMVPPSATSSSEIIPSFHRPALVNYWINHSSSVWTSAINTNVAANGTDFRRSVILRPLEFDHPNFTGSNPSVTLSVPFDPVSGPWDVDNDNDGIPDSIWIDAGLPVVRRSDGRLVKPLVAILVKDMDGLLNLNVHGNGAHELASYSSAEGPFAGGAGFATPLLHQISAARGRGIGPGDIAIDHIFQGTDFADIRTQRYGSDGSAGEANVIDDRMRLKFFDAFNPGRDGQWGSTNDFNEVGSTASDDFVTPDVWGYQALALDYDGQPFVYLPPAADIPSPMLDSPYEMDVSQGGNGFDQPYTWAELEPLLRWHDGDTLSLPGRIVDIARATFQSASEAARRRALVTVDSRDIPIPNYLAPFESIAGTTPGLETIQNLYRSKLTVAAADKARVLRQILPTSLRRGGRFNVNRPIGDGRDDALNQNETTDEPSEAVTTGENVWNDLSLSDFASFNNIPFQYFNEERGTLLDSGFARQLYARYLFVLMMMLTDNSFEPFFDTEQPTDLTAAERRELAVRNLAQWTVNVVDFRDRDAIMTPFEYDANPFNGWGPFDGDPATDEATDGVDNDGNGMMDAADPNESDRRLVWGCEYPDLLITETLAFHDRRVKDTDLDPSGEARVESNALADNDLDQYRIPQGSLFVELYCTGNRNNPNPPAELYSVDTANNISYLDLGRMAPAGTHPDDASRTSQYPVWRIAISESFINDTDESPTDRATNNLNSVTFQPEDMSSLTWTGNVNPSQNNTAASEIRVERIIWFANVDPLDATTANLPASEARSIYYNRSPGPTANDGDDNDSDGAMDEFDEGVLLEPGRYGVVGPRHTTHVGSQQQASPPTAYQPSNQKIVLDNFNPEGTATDPQGVSTWDNTNVTDPVVPQVDMTGSLINAKPALAMVAAANVPTTWMDQTNTAEVLPSTVTVVSAAAHRYGIGVSVSEPLPTVADYYTEPTHQLLSTAAVPFPKDSYYDYDTSMGQLPDEPFDNDTTKIRPLASNRDNLRRTGTTGTNGATEGYKTAYLQRLANPLVAYHPISNPYITVDWSVIDLTVFSGEENTNRQVTYGMGTMAPVDPDDPDPLTTAPDEQFDTRDRLANLGNIWEQETQPPQPNGAPAGTDYFRFNLGDGNRSSLGYLNKTITVLANAPAGYEGSPAQPFPWLTWKNRRYDSPLDLMVVPKSSPSRLLHEFTLNARGGTNPYDAAINASQAAPFGHLLNFFHSSTNSGESGHYYRLFDFIETPSPFVGSETWYSPLDFKIDRGSDGEWGAAGVDDDGNGIVDDSSEAGWPETDDFNSLKKGPDGQWGIASVDDDGNGTVDDISEAGWPESDDLNINEGPDGQWGDAGVDDDLNGTIDDISEAGWAGTDDRKADLRPWYPPFNYYSRFRDPGRVNINTIFDPLIWEGITKGLDLDTSYDASTHWAQVEKSRRGYSATPFDNSIPTQFANPFRPASSAHFAPDASLRKPGVQATLLRSDPDSSANPLFEFISTNEHDDTGKNAHFYYQGITRLGNLLTTHSNVFAIWVTVGYFEVEPNPGADNIVGTLDDIDAGHPDGYQLGLEAGSLTGDVERHRAFYIVDRSIPVAFERGENHNVDRTILLRRRIE